MNEGFFQSDMESVHVCRFLGGEAAVFSTPSPAKETPNEDSAALMTFDAASGVAAVCDGAGGPPGGEHASRTVIHALRAKMEEARRGETPLRAGILNGLEAANAKILAMGQGSASTCAVVEIQDGVIRPYHVGDSMILLIGQRGRIKLQTVSHSPVGFAVESGMMDEQEAVHHEDRHLVSNLVGTAEMRIEVGPRLRLAPRDTLLLATDGVFDNLYLEEVIALVRKGPLREAGDGLMRLCLQRMQGSGGDLPSKPDDLTFVLFRRAAHRE